MFRAYAQPDNNKPGVSSDSSNPQNCFDEVEQPKPLDQNPALSQYRSFVHEGPNPAHTPNLYHMPSHHGAPNVFIPPLFHQSTPQVPYYSNLPGPSNYAQSDQRNSQNNYTSQRVKDDPDDNFTPIVITAGHDAYSSHSTQVILSKRQREQERRKRERKAEALRECVAVRQLRDSSDDDSDEDIMAIQETCAELASIEKFRKKNKKIDEKNRKQKKKKKSKRRHSSSSSDSSSSSSSDSDSDRRSSSHRSKKRKDRKKKSKKRRKRSKSPKALSPKPQAKPSRYAFLRMDRQEHNTSEFLLYDKSMDLQNIHYEKLQPTITSAYYVLGSNIIGAPTKWSTYFYPAVVAKEEKKPKRFHEVIPSEKHTERVFRSDLVKITDTKSIDFIEVSKTKLELFRFQHELAGEKVQEIVNEENRLKLDAEERLAYGMIRPDEIRILEAKITAVKQEIAKTPGENTNYINFVDYELELYERNLELGIKYTSNLSLLDRCLSIIEAGLQKCPLSYDLRLKKLDLLKKKGGTDELLTEWDSILNRFLNKCAVWKEYLDFIQYDSSIYTFKRMEKAFAKCREKLENLLRGIIKSHRPEENTEEFYKEICIRELSFLIESGYTERVMASIQASCEFHLFCPDRYQKLPHREKLEHFKRFWESGHPRVGDHKCHGGWISYDTSCESAQTVDMKTMEKYEIELYRVRVHDLYNRISSTRAPFVQSWVELERQFSNLNLRPLRNDIATDELGESPDDLYKRVSFDDLMIMYSFFPLDILSYFGITFLEYLPPNENTESILRKFGLGSLKSIYESRIFVKFMKNIILSLAINCKESQLMMSYVPICIRHMKMKYENASEKVITKKFISKLSKISKKLEIEDDQIKEMVFYFAAHEAMEVGLGEKPHQFMLMLIKSILKRAQPNMFKGLKSLRAAILFSAMLCYLEMNVELSIDQYNVQVVRWLNFLSDEEPISPKHVIDAWNILTYLETFHFADSQEYASFTELFESSVTTIRSIRIYVSYNRIQKVGRLWLTESIKLIIGEEDYYKPRKALLNIMEYHWENHHSHRLEFLEECKRFIQSFPNYVDGYTKLVKLFSSLRYYKILPFFDDLEKTTSMIGKKYSALSKTQLLARPTDFTSENMRGQSSLVQLAQNMKDCTFWRLILTRYNSENVFVKALEQCCWSKYLMIDRIEQRNNNPVLEQLHLLMMEKETRIIVDIEEVETLLERENSDESENEQAE